MHSVVDAVMTMCSYVFD